MVENEELIEPISKHDSISEEEFENQIQEMKNFMNLVIKIAINQL